MDGGTYLRAALANMQAASTLDDDRLRRALESLASNLFWTGIEMGRSRQAEEIDLPAPFDGPKVGGEPGRKL